MSFLEYHRSVLTQEVLTYLNIRDNGIYVDVTFGGGGHTRALLESNPTITVVALDWDLTAIEQNGPGLQEEFGDRFKLVWGSFAHLTHLLKKEGITHIDGILGDFGTSQYQIAQKAGFSFNADTDLDMRMSPAHGKTTAYDVINKATEAELAEIFYTLGEEYQSRKIARAIVLARTKARIRTTKELATIISDLIPRYNKRIHQATKVFQALRIFVNDELNNIKSLLTQSLLLLNPQGRMVCISFHSLEDRLVKQFFKEHKELQIITKKVVIASPEELSANPSSRSAKLRAAERLAS